jgi:hypothetical protein
MPLDSELNAKPKSTLLLILITALLALVVSGLNFDFLLYMLLVIPLELILFAKWPSGDWKSWARRHLIASVFLGFLLLVLVVVFITVVGAGQLGYGDELMIQGHQITSRGLVYLTKICLFTSGLVFVAAMLTSTISK